MIKPIFIVLLGLFIGIRAEAQDDLLKMLEQEPDSVEKVFATFKTTRIINGQSVELANPGVLNFIIGHRFGKINDGAYQFFGLDQSTIRLGLEYGIARGFSLAIGRSSFQKTYDASVKYRPVVQSRGPGGSPVTVALYAGIALNSLKFVEPEQNNQFSSRLSYFYQALIARKFSSDLSLQITPTLIHRNKVQETNDYTDIYALGAGGRYRIGNRISLNLEYFYQLTGASTKTTYNSVSLGFDIETGGHVFQLHFTNSQGMIENYFVAETFGDISKGDIYFGFNINRVFDLKKKDKYK